MQINDTIGQWIKASNRKKNTLLWSVVWGFGSICIMLVVPALVVKCHPFSGYFALPIMAGGWMLYTRYIRSDKVRVGWGKRDARVPDDLLASIAAAPAIPQWCKIEIARELNNYRGVTFGFLYDLDLSLANAKAHAAAEQKPGFRAMIGFLPKDSTAVEEGAAAGEASPAGN